MKESGVVQGLKSLVHSQLPLSAKESQRLLTALTSSFRRHLDEVHPHGNTPNNKSAPASPSNVPRSDAHTIHSSASYAEKHLASVLTNPLFVRGGKVLDYTTAKADLARDAQKDPIKLLEEYHEKGAASIEIAELCLENYMGKIVTLTEDERQAHLQQHQPGRRALLYLLNSGHSLTFGRDKHRLQDLVVHLLMLEGQEDRVWDWLQLDVKNEKEFDHSGTIRDVHLPGVRHRWRGRLVRGMLASKLGALPNKKDQTLSVQQIHDALDTCTHLFNLVQSPPGAQHLGMLNFHPYTRIICGSIIRHPQVLCKYSATKWQEFIDTYRSVHPRVRVTTGKELATRYLLHPTEPSADVAYDYLQRLYGQDTEVQFKPHDKEKEFLLIKQDSSYLGTWHTFMALTYCVLVKTGRHADAEWVKMQHHNHRPDKAKFFDGDAANFRNITNVRQLSRVTPNEHVLGQVHFPAMA